jgi:integrase
MGGAIKNLRLKNGGYYARIVVPASLRPIIGKSELLASLGAQRRDALRALPQALARMQDELALARRTLEANRRPPRRPLTEAEIAHLHYVEELAIDDADRNVGLEQSKLFEPDLSPHRQGPFEWPADWPVEVRHRSAVTSPAIFSAWARPAYFKKLKLVASGLASDDVIAATIGWAVDKFVDRGNVIAAPRTDEWRKLARILASVQLEAAQRANERDAGEYSGKPALPVLNVPTALQADADAVPIDDLFEAYLSELARSGKGAEARRRWTPVFANLKEFLGHDDAARITRRDVLRWKDKLLETLSAKTVRNAYLASARAVLQFGVDNDRLKENAASGIKLRMTPKPVTREKGFTDAEAAALLKAAREYVPARTDNPQTHESAYVTAAKRWIPWLCAFTGARVAEMGQLRKEDVRIDDPIPHLRITSDAGAVKTGQYRDIPLHPQLLDLGFDNFVRAAPDGPLFYDRKSKRTSAELPARHLSKRLSMWIRGLNILPPDIDPNHAWRHRFKTQARELGIDARVADAIQGHAARTAGENYGDVTLKAKWAAVEKLTTY